MLQRLNSTIAHFTLLLTGIIVLGCFSTMTDNSNTRPNIIIIMSDDMGYSDLGCFGSEINTPTLDELAQNGISFTQFYSAARCCPTRASLLTGLYPHQDNGGCAEEIGTMGETGPWVDNLAILHPLAADEIEYLGRPAITRNGELIIKGKDIAGGPETTFVAYGRVWANVSNTPFREYKHWVHEGGIATPLIRSLS